MYNVFTASVVKTITAAVATSLVFLLDTIAGLQLIGGPVIWRFNTSRGYRRWSLASTHPIAIILPQRAQWRIHNLGQNFQATSFRAMFKGLEVEYESISTALIGRFGKAIVYYAFSRNKYA